MLSFPPFSFSSSHLFNHERRTNEWTAKEDIKTSERDDRPFISKDHCSFNWWCSYWTVDTLMVK